MTTEQGPGIAKAPVSGGGRPKKYRLANGTVVPGVTTIAGKYKDPGPLMWWAWKQGCDGKDFRETRDAAADAGHIAHGWIEDDIHARPLSMLWKDTDPETLRRAETAFDAFLDWKRMVSLQVLSTEHPLVSELHRFGGTYDALALVSGEPMLMDWKTGSGVYPEVIAQLAAYRQLIRESVGVKRELAPRGAVCLRIGKELGDWHVHRYTEEILDAGWRRFLGARAMYDEDLLLSKVCS